MVYRNRSLFRFKCLFPLIMASVALTTLPRAFQDEQLQAQVPPSEETFEIPSSLAEDTTVRIDGSSSMALINEELGEQFEAQFPGSTVSTATNGTDNALNSLRAGEIDLAAIGRSLTDNELQTFTEVPISREKIAIIVGAENSFQGDMTTENFVRIFRGEITNWAEIGGEDLPIRVIDRPDSSDTRTSLSQYDVFQDAPFEIGANGVQLSEDDTEIIIDQLGNDGISYAIANEVLGLESVRVLSMHETMPDEPEYPYSQLRGYAYAGDPDPGVEAFLGIATSPEGQSIVAETREQESLAVAGTGESTPTEGTTAGSETVEEAEVDEEEAIASDTTNDTDLQGISPLWWLLVPLIGLPILFWFLKGRGGAVPPADEPAESRLILTPRNCRDAYAYWEIPDERLAQARREGGQRLMMRLYDVTNIKESSNQSRLETGNAPHSVKQFECNELEPDLHMPIAVDDRDYIAELGYLTKQDEWLPIIRSPRAHVPACPASSDVPTAGVAAIGGAAVAAGVAATAPFQKGPLELGNRLILTPRNCRDAYAYWEVSDEQMSQIRQQGGQQLMIRLYDVTNISDSSNSVPHSVKQFVCNELESDLHIPIEIDDRDYVAELGYVTGQTKWVPVARSPQVRVPACPTFPQSPGVDAAVATVGGTALAAGVIGATRSQKDPSAYSSREGSRVILTPRSSDDLYAYWELSDEHRTQLQNQDNQLRLHLYDVTNVKDTDLPTAQNTRQYVCSAAEQDLHIAISDKNRDYVAELGYVTQRNQWYPLARSQRVHVPEEDTFERLKPLGTAATVGGAALAAGAVASKLARPSVASVQESRVIMTQRSDADLYTYWELSDNHKSELRQQGNQMKLRLYNVTGVRDLDIRQSKQALQYSSSAVEQDKHLSIASMNLPNDIIEHDLVAELGYLTPQNSWIRLATSAPVKISTQSSNANNDTSSMVSKGASDPRGSTPVKSSNKEPSVSDRVSSTVQQVSNRIEQGAAEAATNVGAVAAGGAAIAAGAGKAAQSFINKESVPSESDRSEQSSDTVQQQPTCQIILVPRTPSSAYAYWEVDDSIKASIRKQGGITLMLRVHDATNLDIDKVLPHSTSEYQCTEDQQDLHVTIPVSDRDYIAELGYYTTDHRWLRIIRSFHVHVPSDAMT